MKDLIEYGIKQEQSDIRAHVCPASRCVYVYQTTKMRELVESANFKEASAKTRSITTARGFLVPVEKIPDVRRIPVPEKAWLQTDIRDDDSTTEKGRKAQKLVARLMRYGHFPFWVEPQPIENLQLQYAGVDLLVHAQARIQVKCDLRGGHKESGGTGNLFIQTWECNPFKQF